MNRVYRLVWNSALGAPVVVSELARSRRSTSRSVNTRGGVATSRLAGACVAALLLLPCAGVQAQQVDPRLDELRALADKYTLVEDAETSEPVSTPPASPSTVSSVPMTAPDDPRQRPGSIAGKRRIVVERAPKPDAASPSDSTTASAQVAASDESIKPTGSARLQASPSAMVSTQAAGASNLVGTSSVATRGSAATTLTAASPASSASPTSSASLRASTSALVSAQATSAPNLTGAPTGTVVGNGGLVGGVVQLLDPTLSSALGGDGWVINGSTALNADNVQKAYTSVNVLGLPVVSLSPVGALLGSLGGATTGGNSHLTLIGGVVSNSYLTNVNSGNPGGLLGLLLPDGSPAYATNCVNVLGVITAECWAVNAAQDYQTLVGQGATANGSKEVVIGSNASHTLPSVDARTLYAEGFVDANYDARLGHSVVVGDSASGSANGQTILGANATSDQANSVALGYRSNASRGAASGYTAYGMTTAQTSAGEVAIGAAGSERQLTHVAAGNEDTDAVNVAQLRGAVSQIQAIGDGAVMYDVDAGGVVLDHVTLGATGSGAAVGISNVAAGVAQNDAVNVGQLAPAVAALGGGAAIDSTTGAVTGPVYSLDDGTGTGTRANYTDVGTALENLDGRTTSNTTNITNLLEGTAGLVRQDPTSLTVTVAGQTGGTGVSFRNASGQARTLGGVAAAQQDDEAVNLAQLRSVSGDVDNLGARMVQYDVDAGGAVQNHVTLGAVGSSAPAGISNLAAGVAQNDAVNVGQLAPAVAALGGGAGIDATTGAVTGPVYSLDDGTNTGTRANYSNVGTALENLDGRTTSNTTNINNLLEGAAGLVRQDPNSLTVTVAGQTGGTGVSFRNASGQARTLSGVAAGQQDEDAVNMAQLRSVSGEMDNLNARAVQYDVDANGAVQDHVTLGASGSGAPVGLSNLAAGAVNATSSDAVNGAQLFATHGAIAQFFGGSTQYDSSTGTWTGPTFNITQVDGTGGTAGSSFTNVTDAFGAVSNSLVNLNNRIGQLQSATYSSKYLAVQSIRAAATATGTDGVAVGPEAAASGTGSVAVGAGASASQDNSVALGAGSTTSVGAQSGYDGAYVQAGSSSSAGEVSVGSTGGERKVTHVADGSDRYDAVNVGQLQGGVNYAIDRANAYTDQQLQNIQVESGGMFRANDTAGLGQPSASGDNATAGGAGAVASGSGSTAIGSGAQATADRSVALGAGSVADRVGTVSVGSSGAQRQITNVAAGTADGDAVNMAQFNRGLTGVQDWSRNYVDQRYQETQRDLQRVDNRAMAGVASAMAVAGLPQPYEAGRSMASMAVSGYDGEAGVALGVSAISEGGRWIYRLSGTTNTRGDAGVTVGAGIQW
ncbi:hemagglutinin [Pseudoxanthomonas winnipegensis]|jgi:autotransporter adhesin|uniref:Hemagglutinin n=1 Tax=Pseudoxanthomonas winnipegensis TaxID=2480810 RepID=A0ABY1WEV3_9GAMM|nr:YadA-like family protein [Pseudoxanthomonas winnipegensis]TAA08782.1 hemagglutinin [Pseudoxanthomonas winnipegensis]TAA20482.1 hemagglutinin [Pseudoxanthomonas winnipegensis]TAH71864.1 hemagglutinin [Pseudoxanthomonas winnipegensis]